MANPADKTNKVSNFVRYRGQTKFGTVRIAASVAAEEGSILYPDGSGTYALATATKGDNFVIYRGQTILSTDSDYASIKDVKVEIPLNNDVEWLATVGTGSATAAMEGTYKDLKDSKSIDVTASAKKVVFIKKFLSSTQVVVTFAGNLVGLALPAST